MKEGDLNKNFLITSDYNFRFPLLSCNFCWNRAFHLLNFCPYSNYFNNAACFSHLFTPIFISKFDVVEQPLNYFRKI